MVTAYSAGLEAETLAAAQRCVAGVGAGYPGHDLIRPGAAWLVGRPNDVPAVLPALPDPQPGDADRLALGRFGGRQHRGRAR